MRLLVLWMLVVGGGLGCSGPSSSPDESDAQRIENKAFVSWAADRAITIESLRPSSVLGNEDRLREVIGQARVVGIGESRHDTREQLLLKGRLIRFLVEKMGFRTLILEESVPHAKALDEYVTTGEGDLRSIMNGLAGWYLWDTEEMLEIVGWIRIFNEGRDSDDQIRIFGADITAPALGIKGVLGFLRAAGVKLEMNTRDLGLDLQEGDFWPTTWQRYSTLSEERKASLADSYDALISTVEQQRDMLISRSSELEYERNRWLAEVGCLGHQMFSTADRAQGGAVREHGMAQTLLWILEYEMPGRRAVFWAHNLHVAKSSFRMPGFVEGELEPMGIELAQELGDSYLSIGASFGSGSYSPDLPPGERSFEVMAENTMDGALAGVDLPMFMVDFRAADQNPAAKAWLQREREWRAQDSNVTFVPGSAFDLVYYVDEVSRSQPTPAALESFQELQRQH